MERAALLEHGHLVDGSQAADYDAGWGEVVESCGEVNERLWRVWGEVGERLVKGWGGVWEAQRGKHDLIIQWYVSSR